MADDRVRERVALITDSAAAAALAAERAVVTRLGGGCQMPIGAYASEVGSELRMTAIVVSVDGSRAARAEARGPIADAGAGWCRRGRATAGARRGGYPCRRGTSAGRGRRDPAVRKGVVYLIGAGPGDPDLITVHGLNCLRAADVVLYDHLVPRRLLRHARRDAELIDVGIASPQPMAQEAIGYLLADKAREGKTVARLKWGDPFVFDRGGEEALFLHEQGVAFEVIPGLPAGDRGAGLRRRARHLPGRRRHDDARARLRGREPHGAAHRLDEPGPPRRHRRVLRRRSPAAAHPRGAPLARLAGRGPGRRSSTTARCRARRRSRGRSTSCSRRCARRRDGRRPLSSSAGWSASGNTCAGSTRVRCSAGGCS